MPNILPNWTRSLLQSRKFWLAVIAVSMAIVLFIRGDIAADQLVDTILILAGIVIAAIAVEDAAAKSAGAKQGRDSHEQRPFQE